jgi:hypothetical protein
MRLWLGILLLVAALGCGTPKQDANPASPAPSQAAAAEPDKTSLLGEAGVPVYPDSKLLGTAVSPESGGATHFTVLLGTPDSVDKAVAFYKDQLKFQGSAKGDQYQLVGRSKEGSDILMFFQPDEGETHITIKGILYSKKGG